MIRPILTDNAPLLRQIADEVRVGDIATAGIQGIINDLVATAKSTPCAGLAAPQIGVSLRVVLLMEPLVVLVNPVVTPVGSETATNYEGCLSVPGLRGEVTRPRTVRVQALDRSGKAVDITMTGMRSAVVQHEVDHLNGILYTDLAKFTFEDKAVAAPQVDPGRPSPDGGKKTFVVDSQDPVGGTQYFAWTFHEKGRLVEVRIEPGNALVTGAWLSGTRLRAKDYRAAAANERLLGGPQGLHVQAGDQLRVELRIPKGKKRIVAEADFNGA